MYVCTKMLEELSWARRYAKACASRFPSHVDRDDLQSAGIVAYLGAATRYNHAKGASFRGFCATRIRGAIFDEVRRWSWMPRSAFHQQRLMETSTVALRTQLQREPTLSEIGERMGLDEKSIAEIQRSIEGSQFVSWDELSDRTKGGQGSIADRIADENSIRPDHDTICREDKQALLEKIGRLPQMEALVIVLHYLRDMQLQDVAKSIGVTPARVSQIHRQALGRLKATWRLQNI